MQFEDLSLVELFDGDLAADLCHPRAQAGVGDQHLDRVGQRSRIPGRDEHSVTAGFYHHPAAFDVGGYERKTSGGCFQEETWHAFPIARQDRNGGLA